MKVFEYILQARPKDKCCNEIFIAAFSNLLYYHLPWLFISIYIYIYINIYMYISELTHNHETPKIYKMCTYIFYTCNGIRAPKRQGDRNQRCGKIVDSRIQACSQSLKRKDKKHCAGKPENSQTVANELCNECHARITGDYDSGMESASSSSSGFSTSSGGSMRGSRARRSGA